MSKTVRFQTILFSIIMQVPRLIVKTFLFQAIKFSETVQIQTVQLSIRTQFSSILLISRTLIRCYHSVPECRREWWQWRVLCIPQSSSITGTSPSDCLVSYPGHLLGVVLLLCRGALGVFYSPSRLANIKKRSFRFASINRKLTGRILKKINDSLIVFVNTARTNNYIARSHPRNGLHFI